MERESTAVLPPLPRVCGLADDAALLRVHRGTLRLWLRAPLVPSTQEGGQPLIDPQALLACFHRLLRLSRVP